MPDKTFDHSAEQTDRQFLASNPRASDSFRRLLSRRNCSSANWRIHCLTRPLK